MTGVAITIKGSDAAFAVLAKAQAALATPRGLYADIGRQLVVSAQSRFAAEKDPDGSPWPVSMRAALDGGKTLTHTARLKNSITSEAGDREVAVGTNAIYAAIHQFGGVIKAKTAKGLKFRPAGGNGFVTVMSVTMPKRAFLGLDQDDEAYIAKTAAKFMAQALGQTDAG